MPTLVDTRCLDKTGRIVLPMEIRLKFGLNEKSYIDVLYDEDSIILKQNHEHTLCSACMQHDVPMLKVGKIQICEKCADKIKKL